MIGSLTFSVHADISRSEIILFLRMIPSMTRLTTLNFGGPFEIK